MNIKVSKNDPVCGCDGNINIFATEGVNPYTYSVDSGLTFHNAPTFKNLCHGLYTITVVDFSGNVSTTSTSLNKPSLPTIYTITLNRSESTTVNTTNLKTNLTTVSLTITPELPDYSYITLDLIHTNNFNSSPTLTAATVSTNSNLTKNNSGVTISISGVSTGTTFNTYPGCQDQTVFITTYTEQWSGLQINKTDNIILSTTTSVSKNIDTSCYFYSTDDNYSISNVSIHNCSCCRVIKF